MQGLISSDKGISENNNNKLEIVYKLHGVRSTRELGRFIRSRVLPVKEEYPYAEIRIEVDV